uniref:Uncharacterized protein n=1 Tax=Arundo donax TaxID=35708 RepID=A0A0A9AZK7_ARUDO
MKKITTGRSSSDRQMQLHGGKGEKKG